MDIIGQNGNDGLHYKYEDDAVSFIEKQYPETAKEFKKIQEEQYETFCKKQMDYGPSNISMGTGVGSSVNTHLSLTALVVRINDKIQRLKQLVVLGEPDTVGESINDTFQDLSVYGIIAQIVQQKKFK